MLRTLTIRSFALIDTIELEFSKGLTVLVGETGAGKSIIMDSLNAALGSRLASDSVREGAKKAVIEATFDVTQRRDLKSILDAHDLDWDEHELILRRELTASGNSRLFINDTPSTTTIAREIAEGLLDFHGQHDTHGLLNASHHLSVLDAAANNEKQRTAMAEAWTALKKERQLFSGLQQAAQTADEERLRLEFVIKDLEDVSPVPNEDQQVETELKRAESSEQILSAAVGAREAIYTGENSAYDQLKRSHDLISQLVEFNPDLESVLSDIESALTTCKESAAWVEPMARTEDHSPEHVESLRERSASLNRLIKKYGSLENAIETLQSSKDALSRLSNLDASIEEQKAATDKTEKAALKAAKALSTSRSKTIDTFVKGITDTIQQLGMPKAEFGVSMSKKDIGNNGIDNVEFVFSANAGQDLRSLSKIASGGELSRVMVAIKKALTSMDAQSTLVFDEIDTGISGSTARKVGLLINEVAGHHQVICITHLPQIASLASHMIRVTKSDDGNRTVVSAGKVSEEDTITEVARLMSGTEITEAAIEGAKELRISADR